MKQNMKNNERVIRVVAGVVILILGFYFKSKWGFVGLVPLITGAVGYCPLYSICPMSCKK